MTKINEFDQRAQTWDEDQMKVDRAKAVTDAMRQIIPLSQDMKALEYGCGTGLVTFNLYKLLKSITMADSSDGMISVLNEKIRTGGISNLFPVNLDLTTDSLDEKFDLIYTSMTLHHIIEVDDVLSKFADILNPSGYLCIADLDEEDGSFHGEGFEGHNGFNRNELTKKLEDFGLKTIYYEICFQMKRKHTGEKLYNVFVLIAKKIV